MARSCEECGADITHRDQRARFCNESCAKRKPCRRCGGKKGPGKRRYCTPCQEVANSADQVRAVDRERHRRKRLAALESGQILRRVKSNDPGQKWCAYCQQFRPITSFGGSGGKLSAYCIPCTREYNHSRALVRQFGITAEEYASLLELQDGRCAICLTRPRRRRLAVDHDHETGEVRGLLCTRCNHGILGKAHDSASMLRRAVAYLEEPPARTKRAVREFWSEQAELEFTQEQLPFLNDWQAAQSADGKTVAITLTTFLKLVQYAGLRLVIGERVFTPPQLSLFDEPTGLSRLAEQLKEAGY